MKALGEILTSMIAIFLVGFSITFGGAIGVLLGIAFMK